MNPRELGLVSMVACLILLFDIPVIGVISTLALGIILSCASRGIYRKAVALIVIYIGYETVTRMPILMGGSDLVAELEPLIGFLRTTSILPSSDSVNIYFTVLLGGIIFFITGIIFSAIFYAPYLLLFLPLSLTYTFIIMIISKALSGTYLGVPWLVTALSAGNLIILPLASELMMIYLAMKLAARFRIGEKWGIWSKLQ